ncbi:hypothetical protein AXY43_23015 [Clostridium sp. MF28]|uniref:hypothetical protein n=1 Tax=Clostridium TaxID=1485 RepID=UPI000CFA4740|nr:MULTISPECIES: hypothetical protein [Clostridium]AVK50654.1 hypothetical protein AXY43_23015 [Clostridium sp. MF28]PSM59017.1 hypothetical protein C4L39_03930 [Clostridium diolis]
MNLELKAYKNYKEICAAMDWVPTTGKGRPLQFKDLERFCNYHKQGQKIIIDEIFSEPLPKEDNKRNSIYAENVDKLLVHMCSELYDSKYKYIELSTNGMLVKLHMINRNYRIGRNNIDKFSRYLEIPIETLYDFFNSTHKKNKDITESGLNRLKNKCLIDWYLVRKVCTVDGDYRNATDAELEGIKEIEQEILKNLYLKSKKDVFTSGKWNKFMKEKSKMLREMMNLQFDFDVYHIVTTKSFRTMLLEEQEKESIEWELNWDIQSSAIKSAENRHTKIYEQYRPSETLTGRRKYFGIPYYDKEKNRFSKDYIDDTKRVIRICIDAIDPIDLWEAIKDIEDKKYTYHESTLTDTQKEYELLGVNTAEWDALFG